MIQLYNVTRRYKVGSTETLALDHVSLTIRDGELTAIIGASGSGKSTLMHILGCLDTDYEGEYFLDDVCVRTLNRVKTAEIRNGKIGFIFQKYHLIPELSVYENVELPLVYAKVPKAERRQRVQAVLERVGLESKLKNHPGQLSGGQQQRVSIARALVGEPSIILADEPTGALDSATGREVMNLLRSLNDGSTTVVCITHDRGIASEMNRIITISDGRVLEDTGAWL